MEDCVTQHMPYQVDGKVLVPWRIRFGSLVLLGWLKRDSLQGGRHGGCFDAGGLSMLEHDVTV